MRHNKKRSIAVGAALALMLTLSACDTENDDPNGNNGDTGDNTTTTFVSDTTTTLADLTSTTAAP